MEVRYLQLRQTISDKLRPSDTVSQTIWNCITLSLSYSISNYAWLFQIIYPKLTQTTSDYLRLSQDMERKKLSQTTSDYLRQSQEMQYFLRLSQIISDYLRLVAQFYPSKYRDEARRGEQCLKQTEDVFGPVSERGFGEG